jgi:hypothetical protein
MRRPGKFRSARCAKFFLFPCANRLRQPRRHWQLAASDDAPYASVINKLCGDLAGDDPS